MGRPGRRAGSCRHGLPGWATSRTREPSVRSGRSSPSGWNRRAPRTPGVPRPTATSGWDRLRAVELHAANDAMGVASAPSSIAPAPARAGWPPPRPARGQDQGVPAVGGDRQVVGIEADPDTSSRAAGPGSRTSPTIPARCGAHRRSGRCRTKRRSSTGQIATGRPSSTIVAVRAERPCARERGRGRPGCISGR